MPSCHTLSRTNLPHCSDFHRVASDLSPPSFFDVLLFLIIGVSMAIFVLWGLGKILDIALSQKEAE
jgi:hypothetical protein